MSKKRILLFFVMLTLVFSTISGQNSASPKTIKVMSFNIQIFGVAKMAKPEVVDILIDLVSQADIIAVQEVRSVSVDPVEQFMALLPGTYRYVLGPRQGRSSSKEQYWVIYNSEKITVLEEDSWPDEEDFFERSPQAVYLKTNGTFDFILLNNHIQPRAAEKEIRALPQVVTYYRDLWNDPDVMIMGDFNADGQYFDSALLDSIFPETEYKSIITGEYDTTLAQSHNTYDRFIITTSVIANFTGNFGVIRFDEAYDFSAYSISPKEVSDHYPIWAEFWVSPFVK
jgi:endonuclease/exonuclease/phosphatase family metal-dependent hydrolase